MFNLSIIILLHLDCEFTINLYIYRNPSQLMKTIFSLKTYILSFHFYRQFIVISLITTFLLYFSFTAINGSSLNILIGSKLFLICLVYLFYLKSSLKQKLTFYKNFGLSQFHLFLLFVIYDIFITLLIVLLLDRF